MITRRPYLLLLAVSAVLTGAPALFAQGFGVQMAPPSRTLSIEEATKVVEDQKLSPEDREKLRNWNKRRVDFEKQMKTLRFKHFGSKEKVEIRQNGIRQLRTITDPAAFPGMIEIFHDERQDVLDAVCQHLADLDTPESIATLAYAAIYEKRPEFRAAATKPLVERLKARKPWPDGLHTVVASALDSDGWQFRAQAASLVQSLHLIEAIPGLITGQISVGGGSAGGYIAWIAVGTQTAYVADLTPVVGDGSVAFDPVPGVLTTGVVLAINDAVAVQYIVPVHDVLLGLTREAYGRDTAYLGWNPQKWMDWYTKEFIPQQKAAEEAAKKPKARAKSPKIFV